MKIMSKELQYSLLPVVFDPSMFAEGMGSQSHEILCFSTFRKVYATSSISGMVTVKEQDIEEGCLETGGLLRFVRA